MDTKSLFESKTFWGTILQVIAMGAVFLKIDLGDLTLWAESITALIGAGVAIYGRITAIKKIV